MRNKELFRDACTLLFDEHEELHRFSYNEEGLSINGSGDDATSWKYFTDIAEKITILLDAFGNPHCDVRKKVACSFKDRADQILNPIEDFIKNIADGEKEDHKFFKKVCEVPQK